MRRRAAKARQVQQQLEEHKQLEEGDQQQQQQNEPQPMQANVEAGFTGGLFDILMLAKFERRITHRIWTGDVIVINY